MSVEAVARRYASALADVVLKTGETQTVKSELDAWNELIRSNPSLKTAFESPAIPHAKKQGILEGLLDKAKPSKTTANFLRVLLENKRLGNLNAINTTFESVIEERSGLVSGTVTSSRDLSEEQKNELKENLQRLTGKTVRLGYSIDPYLIGGVVARIGSTVYDTSVRTKLENFKEELMNG